MREAINELKYVFIEHSHSDIDKDITAIISRSQAIEIFNGLDFAQYNDISVNFDGEYLMVSSIKVDGTELFIESIYTTDGVLKYDETDILIIPSTLPQELRVHAVNICGYKKLKSFGEDVTYEEIIEFIER
jgi:hypothetical protein